MKLWYQVKLDGYEFKPEILEQVDSIGGESPKSLRGQKEEEVWDYYKWLGAYCREFQPKQVVELGGAWGTAAIIMASETDGKVYSITLDEKRNWNGEFTQLAFIYAKKDYPNLIKVIGDDLDLNSWPKDLDLSQTDFWFIDTLHTMDQLTKELELYKPFFKKGAIVAFDDIHLPELFPVWLDLPFEKLDVSQLHIPTGWGIAIV